MFKISRVLPLLVICNNAISAELWDPTRPFGYYEAQVETTTETTATQEPYLPLKIGLDPNRYKLNGIIVAKSGNSAILNGRRVRVGDMIADATVTEIARGYMVLEGDGDRLKIELLSLMVKQPIQRTDGGDK